MAAQKNTGSILHLSLHSLSQNSSALRRIPSISSAGPPSWGKQGEEDPPPSSPTLTPVDRTVQSSYCHNPPKQESLLHKSPPPPRAYYQEGSLSHDVTTSKENENRRITAYLTSLSKNSEAPQVWQRHSAF